MTTQLIKIDQQRDVQETMNKVVKSENANFSIFTGSDLVNVIGEMAGVLPLNGENIKNIISWFLMRNITKPEFIQII